MTIFSDSLRRWLQYIHSGASFSATNQARQLLPGGGAVKRSVTAGLILRDGPPNRLRVRLRAKQPGPVPSESVQAPDWCKIIVSAAQLPSAFIVFPEFI